MDAFLCAPRTCRFMDALFERTAASFVPHAHTYTRTCRIMDALFERDPNGSVLAFADMMKKQIVMPAHLMDDNQHQAKHGRNLFAVSQLCLWVWVGACLSGVRVCVWVDG